MSKEPIHPQPSRTQASDLAQARLTQKALTEYQRKVGKLMFAATTIRGDIQLAVGKLAQGSKGPNQIHLEQVDRGLKYLHRHGVPQHRLQCGGPAATTLHGYCDADFSRNLYTTSVGADDEVVHCTTGYLLSVRRRTHLLGSKKQSAPVLSSMEAELVAAVSQAQEAAYLRRLIEEMGVPQQRPTPIFTDSKSLVALDGEPDSPPTLQACHSPAPGSGTHRTQASFASSGSPPLQCGRLPHPCHHAQGV